MKPSTLTSNEFFAKKHIVPGLGHHALRKLDPQTLSRFFATKQESGLSGRSVQYLHAIIRKSLADALKDGLVVRNVACLVKAPRAQTKPVEPLSPDEVRALLAAIRGDRLQAHRQRQELKREFAGKRWLAAIVQHDGDPLEAGLVFGTSTGTPLDSRNATQRFQTILKNCGLFRHRFHTASMTCGTAPPRCCWLRESTLGQFSKF